MIDGVGSEVQTDIIQRTKENWGEVVIKADDLLGWKEGHYPFIIVAVITAAYSFIWYWDPTLLTFLAFLGLIVNLTDYLGPIIIKQVCNSESWGDAKKEQFAKVCDEVVAAMNSLSDLAIKYKESRAKKPNIHLIATVISLLTLAWIGNCINNFLLAYLLTLAVAMTPGLMRRGIIQTQFSQISIKIGELLKGKEALKKEK